VSNFDVSPKPGDGVKMTGATRDHIQRVAMKAVRDSALSAIEVITIRGAARKGVYKAAQDAGRRPLDSDFKSAEYSAINAAVDLKLREATK